jgi:hypothetical protein
VGQDEREPEADGNAHDCMVGDLTPSAHNLKTVKALGIPMSDSLFMQATAVTNEYSLTPLLHKYEVTTASEIVRLLGQANALLCAIVWVEHRRSCGARPRFKAIQATRRTCRPPSG